jgi:hypothetical protein
MDLTKQKGIPDTIHLEDLTDEEIIEEHYYLTEQEQVYSDMFNLKYPAIYEQDIQPILNIEDARDFYTQYYLPAIVDMKGTDDGRLSPEEIKILNESVKLSIQAMELADRMDKTDNIIESLGLRDKLGDRMEVLDATIQGKVIKELFKFMDS